MAITTIASSINEIVQFFVPALFRRQHINRKLKIGFIGLPGEGKSTSAALTALFDGMLQGEKCWSNMQVKCTFNVSDEMAGKFRLKGGTTTFEAETLDKKKLLRMDPEYSNGWTLLDEINMEFGEARRSMSTTNLFFNRADQQYRHLDLGLLYTVIHEMWIDPRIRNLTDIFVRCEDPALSPEGLNSRKPLGETVKWTIYPMTRLFNGHSYMQNENMPLETWYIKTRQFWGIHEYKKRIAEGDYQYNTKIKDLLEREGEIEESPVVKQEKADWGWLYDEILQMHIAEIYDIKAKELWARLRLEEKGISPVSVGKQLSKMGVSRKYDGFQVHYLISDFNLVES